MPSLPEITETDWESSIVDLAHLFGYMVAGFRPARTERTALDKKGRERQVWVTPVKYDGTGFPDLVLANQRRKRLLFVELKSRTGKLTKGKYVSRKGRLDYLLGQEDWIRILKAAGAEVYIWKVGEITLEQIAAILE